MVKGQRDELLQFWLSCPDDALEGLWAGLAGQATRELVVQLTPTTFFSESQIALRNQLGQFLHAGFQQPGAVKAIIATFLLSPPGQFRIVNPESHLPSWLVPTYRSIYEQGQASINNSLISGESKDMTKSSVDSIALSPPKIDFGSFPASLSELVGNRLHLNRLLGLSNLFYIDPDDSEICNELLIFRDQLSKLILDADESMLSDYFNQDFGDRYWALVRSGIQSVPLTPEREALKQQMKDRLSPALGGGFGKPGAIAAFLVAMTYYQPGTMHVEGAQQKLPQWLLSGYQEVFASALQS